MEERETTELSNIFCNFDSKFEDISKSFSYLDNLLDPIIVKEKQDDPINASSPIPPPANSTLLNSMLEQRYLNLCLIQMKLVYYINKINLL